MATGRKGGDTQKERGGGRVRGEEKGPSLYSSLSDSGSCQSAIVNTGHLYSPALLLFPSTVLHSSKFQYKYITL